MTVLNYNYELKVMTALGLMFVMLYSSIWIQTSIIMKLGTKGINRYCIHLPNIVFAAIHDIL